MPTTWTNIPTVLLGFRLFKKYPGARNMKNEGLRTDYTVQCTLYNQPQTKDNEKWKKKQMPTLKDNRHICIFGAMEHGIRTLKYIHQKWTKATGNEKATTELFDYLVLGKGQIGKDRYMYNVQCTVFKHSHSHMYVTVVLSLSLQIYSVLKCKKVFIYRTIYNVESNLWLSNFLLESKENSRHPNAHAFSELSSKLWKYILYTLFA